MKIRDFTFVGNPIPKLNEKEHNDFLLNLQKSILFSLKSRNLLTNFQLEQCLLELEKRTGHE
ncbi:MAG: hypothetical protein HFG80_11205 [Eubacterium sp.]|nr:hypothetical protein [Eubacterium sp.]